LQLIDSHCHLNFQIFQDDRAAVIERAKMAGLSALINPGTSLADSREIVALSAAIPELYAAVGVHPNEAGQLEADTLAQLQDLAGRPKVVAIGEIGLDYYWDKTPRSRQQTAFEAQLALAKSANLPVIIHQREAAADTMAILRQWAGAGEHPGLVLHSFSGDRAMAEAALDLGFYLGFAGPLTFKNVRDLPDLVASLPPERLLVETDAPFLSPHPFRGKRNEPARLRLVVERMAELQQQSLASMSRHLTENTLALFQGLKIDERRTADAGNRG
jgi:TatD DNase family protein